MTIYISLTNFYKDKFLDQIVSQPMRILIKGKND